MMKQRCAHHELPANLSPRSFEVATIPDLLNIGGPLERAQYIAAHAHPRNTH